jgi:hypothetical protein
MMGFVMKSAALLLCVIALGSPLLSYGADSSGVQTVYLLPMANGLDQYVANRLAASGVFHVTTDPKKADAIFTDKLGEAFEQRLDSLLLPPEEKSSKESKAEERAAPRVSTFSRSKGTMFLVDAATRAVLWSIYERPKNTSPGELDRAAQRIVSSLKAPVKR